MNDNDSLCVRGICNASRVSCHIACAIQILCHAIPTVRFALRRILDGNDSEEEAAAPIPSHHSSSSAEKILLEELLGFVRDGGGDPSGIVWNPQRLYGVLEKAGGGEAPRLDPNNVGDATRSLSVLLRLLSHEAAPGGRAWKRLLETSVWEGQTRQVLEGRRLLPDNPAPGGDEPEADNESGGVDCSGSNRAKLVERRYLQRVKPALKNKPMSSPLILRFRNAEDSDGVASTGGGTIGDPNNAGSWGVIQALNEVVRPQTMKGSSYPWESLSPDTYSEREIVCRERQHFEERTEESDSSSSSGESECDDDSSSEGESESESESESDDDDDDTNWTTSKRIEIRCIPRVWLLHLDRPRVSIDMLRALFKQDHNLETGRVEKEESDFTLFHHVCIPVELNPSSIVTKREDAAIGGEDDSDVKNSVNNCEGHDEIASPANLFLRGAIVQVLELDDDDNEEDWEGGHSVTLLRSGNDNDNSDPWLLVDDDKCQPISETRALAMMGGVLEANRHTNEKDDDNDSVRTGSAYYAASLLVYSVLEDHRNEEWMQHIDDLVSSWNDHKRQLAATIQAEESLVGKRLRIKWSKGKFYAGTVTRYDRPTGKHRVTYDDGDVKDYVLAKKTIEWIE
ncbi:unnamed protein product [Pseudo-nitzschia multistriata]|uniref:PTM/DIR17-like Tudor domain-containing protein n=1 Tax=Pseudo-nitzschia multistriata TaxID=183589 RepID=A0A448YYK8_9STRA|nr:unnamed protein product [Pseudo-nitzschia multistriata]